MGLYVDIIKQLDEFTLEVQFEAGNHKMALLGASGSGKSMTLKCIAGIEKPDRGQIVLDGEVLFDSQKGINLSPQQRRTGYLFQNYALFPNMTVAENIGIALKGAKGEIEQQVHEKLVTFYLEGLADRYPAQLSGGQQQRVALARIFASNPRMLMLDEPFSALDSNLKWQLEQELQQILNNYEGTTLFVSHQRDEVYRLCDEVAVMNQGNLEIYGEKWAIYHQPQYLSAAELTGCKNYSLLKKNEDDYLEAIDWNLSFSLTDKIDDQIKYLGIRPEYIQLVDATEPYDGVCEDYTIIEDTSKVTILIKQLNHQPLKQPIIWEMAKPYYQPISHEKILYIFFPREKLLFLK